MFTILRHMIHRKWCGFCVFLFVVAVFLYIVLGSFCITLKYFSKLLVIKLSISSLPLQWRPCWRVTSLKNIAHAVGIERKKGTQWYCTLENSPSRVCQLLSGLLHFPQSATIVILQDNTAVSLSRTHFVVLMKTITLDNSLKTFTLIQNFMKIQLLFK